MLLAYCNHGDRCATTFKNAHDLDSFSEEQVRNLAERFVMTSAEERVQCRFTSCPPHVRKNWLLGVARRERVEARRLPATSVIQAMTGIRFVWDEDIQLDWHSKAFVDMSQEEKDDAKNKWREADAAEEAEELAAAGEGDHAQANPWRPSLDAPCLNAEDAAIRERMRHFLKHDLKWGHTELHDALIAAGVHLPTRPSLMNYFIVLHIQFGNDQTGFLPQSQQSHSIKRLKAVLIILKRTGSKLGGRVTEKKDVLSQRLAHWLNQVGQM